MQNKSAGAIAAAGVVAVCAFVLTTGCSFNLFNYAARNACDFLNCDVLFFVDDLLPLSGGPVAGAAVVEDDGGGGH